MEDSNIVTAMAAGWALLAALIVTLNRNLRRDIGERIDGLDKRMDNMGKRQNELAERMAKLEGLLEGLREAIAGRRAA